MVSTSIRGTMRYRSNAAALAAAVASVPLEPARYAHASADSRRRASATSSVQRVGIRGRMPETPARKMSDWVRRPMPAAGPESLMRAPYAPAAFATISAIRFSSSELISVMAHAVGHMVPSSRWAGSKNAKLP